ncbi:MAG TPA: alpha/beta fold hydrolase [Noviherbaspirillum sp.]|nr:alpha/beta fold hydrolase [Noviherbaspirillum sp.]
MTRLLAKLAAVVLALALPLSGWCDTASPRIGIVIMHGKGGSPARQVNGLASALEEKGFLVANLEMPWSGRRDYDADVGAAENEVEAALAALRGKGADKLFVAGHSQGGMFAFYFGSRHAVDGIIAIAPGGDVSGATFVDKLGEPVARARQLVAEGKGNEKARFADYEGAKGLYPIVTTAAAYLSWFDPDGAMGRAGSPANVKPGVPVLYVAPRGDYPALLKVKQSRFQSLPPHPLTRLYEPDASHVGAPFASAEEIARWTAEVAAHQTASQSK